MSETLLLRNPGRWIINTMSFPFKMSVLLLNRMRGGEWKKRNKKEGRL
jgi:hypothetical protein